MKVYLVFSYRGDGFNVGVATSLDKAKEMAQRNAHETGRHIVGWKPTSESQTKYVTTNDNPAAEVVNYSISVFEADVLDGEVIE